MTGMSSLWALWRAMTGTYLLWGPRRTMTRTSSLWGLRPNAPPGHTIRRPCCAVLLRVDARAVAERPSGHVQDLFARYSGFFYSLQRPPSWRAGRLGMQIVRAP